MVPDKVRIRFRKDDDLRLVSHHDLMRCFERMLRRAALPFHSTGGFHPKPRLVFALSLPLGVVGCEEVVELELDQPTPPEEVQARLTRQAPPGLTILSVQRIAPRLTGQVRRLCYRIALPPERLVETASRSAQVMAAPSCVVERQRPTSRQIDVRPFLHDLRLCDSFLEIHLWMTPQGTARPEEILTLLQLKDVLQTGAVLERKKLELLDEAPTTAEPSESLATDGSSLAEPSFACLSESPPPTADGGENAQKELYQINEGNV